jgi:hypothetical protein
MAFICPDAKSLLYQITGVRLVADQAEGKLIQRLVITGHQTFKVQAVSHIATFELRVGNGPNVPAKRPVNKIHFEPLRSQTNMKLAHEIQFGNVKLHPTLRRRFATDLVGDEAT